MTNPAKAVQPDANAVLPMELLTPEQLASRLHVKPSWVYEQTRYRADIRNADPFPFIKMGKFIRFDWNDVLVWIERQKQRQKRESVN